MSYKQVSNDCNSDNNADPVNNYTCVLVYKLDN